MNRAYLPARIRASHLTQGDNHGQERRRTSRKGCRTPRTCCSASSRGCFSPRIGRPSSCRAPRPCRSRPHASRLRTRLGSHQGSRRSARWPVQSRCAITPRRRNRRCRAPRLLALSCEVLSSRQAGPLRRGDGSWFQRVGACGRWPESLWSTVFDLSQLPKPHARHRLLPHRCHLDHR